MAKIKKPAKQVKTPKIEVVFPHVVDKRDPSPKVLARAARVAYERFLKESGYDHDARVKEWGKLAPVHQKRWAAIARAVLKSFRGEDQRGSESDVQRTDGRGGGLRQRVGRAQTQEPADSDSGA